MSPAEVTITAPYFVRCLGCSNWQRVERGNHHPWCIGCASDEFDWSDERDADPEAVLNENLKGAGRE